ncbi:hypothetical protein BJ875DRAFT_523745 [Amylocarpus encephaloides]|uniref:Rhodopsin domain-containing protein n=1 Tax=Amylocarpus encephaloides TaxID=45428 RepID=A0A9P7YN10_9HELO|nr:hypothetical protein BJ875DRAFT_523745 [Amylocarpus encephaloides]
MSGSMFYEKAGHNLAAAIALPILDAGVVALRVYTRRKQRLPLQVDDWLIFVALILVIGACAASIVGVSLHGLGYPTPEPKGPPPAGNRPGLLLTLPEIVIATKIEYALQILTIPALGLVKLSVLFFFHRIFCPQKTANTKSRYAILFMMALVILWMVGYWMSAIFICGNDFGAFFGNTKGLKEKCGDVLLWLYTLAITDLVTDLGVLVLPLPLLWKLQIAMRKKIAISVVFALGSVATIASAVRLINISKYYRAGFGPQGNLNSTITGVIYWTLIEVGIGLFAACLPTIRFLFKGMGLNSTVKSLRQTFSVTSTSGERRGRIGTLESGTVGKAEWKGEEVRLESMRVGVFRGEEPASPPQKG